MVRASVSSWLGAAFHPPSLAATIQPSPLLPLTVTVSVARPKLQLQLIRPHLSRNMSTHHDSNRSPSPPTSPSANSNRRMMSLAQIHRRFARVNAGDPSFTRLHADRQLKHAPAELRSAGKELGLGVKTTPRSAVLLGLFNHPRTGAIHVLLTERSAQLRSHAGDVALPGGKRDPEDTSDVVTALREAEEEIGLPREYEVASWDEQHDEQGGQRQVQDGRLSHEHVQSDAAASAASAMSQAIAAAPAPVVPCAVRGASRWIDGPSEHSADGSQIASSTASDSSLSPTPSSAARVHVLSVGAPGLSKHGLVVTPIIAQIPIPDYLLHLTSNSSLSATSSPSSSSSPACPPRHASFTVRLNSDEVACLFSLPLDLFLDPHQYAPEAQHQPHSEYPLRVRYGFRDIEWRGRRMRMHEFRCTLPQNEYVLSDGERQRLEELHQRQQQQSSNGSSSPSSPSSSSSPFPHEREFRVWGLTAYMLVGCAQQILQRSPSFSTIPAPLSPKQQQHAPSKDGSGTISASTSPNAPRTPRSSSNATTNEEKPSRL